MPAVPYYSQNYQPYQSYNAYAPNYNQQTFPQQSYSPMMQTANGITWVQGEAAAKAYPVAAGTSVLLMDSEDKCFYIKTTDASGMPQPIRVFTYEEVVQTQNMGQSNNAYALPDFHPEDYAKKQEVEELRDQMNRLVRQQENQQINPTQPQQGQNQNQQSMNMGGQTYAQ